MEKFSEEDVGADIEVTGFSGLLTVSLFIKENLFYFHIFNCNFSSIFLHRRVTEFGTAFFISKCLYSELTLAFFSRVGFPEMPDLSIKVVPTYGEKTYAYTLLQDFMAAKIRGELKVWNFPVEKFLISFDL